jgi:hypothetical protein
MSKPVYQIMDRGDLHKYRTEIPNMLDDSDLSVYAFRLYVHLKRVAGDGGQCYQSTATMAKACKMSMASVSKAKNELMLAGLIILTVKKGEHGEFDSHLIEIKDIWAENYSKYAAYSPREQDRTHSEQDLSYDANRTVSPRELKKEPIKKEHNNTRATNPLYPIAKALCDVVGMDFEKNKPRLFKEAKDYYKPGDEVQIVNDYGAGGAWYLHDWRGKRGDAPTLAQIRETWGALKPGAVARPTNGKTVIVPPENARNSDGSLNL